MSHAQKQCNQLNKPAQLMQDPQQITNHTDLAQHFVSNSQSTQQYAQPVLMATSSGLLLTTALPTVITSHLSSLQPLSQQQMPPLHQFNHMPQQQQQQQSQSQPNGASITSNFLTSSSNFPFSVNVTAAQTTVNIHQPINTSILAGIPPTSKSTTILKSSLPNSTYNSSNMLPTPTAIVNPQKNGLLTLSMPPPLVTSTPIISTAVACVQTKDIPSILTNYEIKEVPTCVFNNVSSNSATKQTCTTQDKEHVEKLISTGISSVSQMSAVPSQLNNSGQSVSPNKIITMEESMSSDSPSSSSSTDATALLLSPKSALLERIQQKETDESSSQTDQSSQPSDSSYTRDVMQPTTINTEITATIPECSKSPILSQPKTIRFPVNNTRHGNHRAGNRMIGCCYWDDCNAKCESSSNLLDHLQSHHVNTQIGPFTCRWENCKVHGRESSSRKWLERHVLSHGGSKLFKCIFEKCRLRFGSQVRVGLYVLV